MEDRAQQQQLPFLGYDKCYSNWKKEWEENPILASNRHSNAFTESKLLAQGTFL
jgi:hypothetical protein